jgi:endonuclease/exonuclease/phosphatase (EEP) superfamily protein YafD
MSKSLVMAVVSVFLITACSSIPSYRQFVTSHKAAISRSNGVCLQLQDQAEAFIPAAAENQLNPEEIRLLNWNIYKGQEPGWQDDLMTFAGSSDILLLQEASFGTELEKILLSSDHYINVNSAFIYRGLETGVLTASKAKPLTSCGLREKEPLLSLPKTGIISRYQIAGLKESLLIANIHGINITLGITAYKRQFEKLYQLLADHQGPMIIAGDFNNWTRGRKTVIEVLTKDLGLTLLGFEDDQRTRFFGDPVDHFLYRGVQPVYQTSYKVASSDHNPIAVSFRITSSSLANKHQ